VFFFTRTHVNAMLLKYLAIEHRYNTWGGSYADVLPYVLEAFAMVIREFSLQVPELVRSQIVEMVTQLCDPDPNRRGHPLTRHNNSSHHSLERYISLLNLLEHRAATSVTQGR
jgi:eukaryotic-like serine/threonine-protein kinase